MNKFMKGYAKISSWVVICLSLIGVVYALYQNTTDGFFIISPLIVIPIIFVYVGIFCTPLFYYAWNKKQKNKLMKIWAKIVTIILPVYIIVGFISNPETQSLGNLLENLISLLPIVPLYYFGWRE